jgi:hypothetical protein
MDRRASEELLRRRFPKDRWKPLADGRLSFTAPSKPEVLVAAFPGLTIRSAKDFRTSLSVADQEPLGDRHQRPDHVLRRNAQRLAWAAFAVWENGSLARPVSMTSGLGVVEELGSRLRFEDDCWSSRRALPPPTDRPDAPPPPCLPWSSAEPHCINSSGSARTVLQSRKLWLRRRCS